MRRKRCLTTYVLECEEGDGRSGVDNGRFVIPVTVDDLAANGLLEDAPPSRRASARQGPPAVCWERSVETLTARKGDIEGLAVASDERIEACVLYVKREAGTEIVSLRSFVEDGGARLQHLIRRLGAQGVGTIRFPKVHPDEISGDWLEALGFRADGGHRLYATTAQSG